MSDPPKRARVRPIRLADMVARALRDRILDGELRDGDTLPTLDRLVDEFGVSPASVREALRILETEGLVSVRRGKFGGAVVHRPTPDAAARMIGMVLQSEGITQLDLAAAQRELVPLCASLLVRQPELRAQVLPRLRDLHERAEAAVDDPVEFERLARAFHNEFVANCGNRSLIVTVGMLERLWSEQEIHWRQRINDQHDYPDDELRRRGLDDHLDILRAAEQGDANAVADLFRSHMADSLVTGVDPSADRPVRAVADG